MTDTTRRTLLKGSIALGTLSAAGLLSPRLLLADWPEAAFTAKEMEKALQDLVGTAQPTASDKIKIKAPDIAENGAVVPITVESDLEEIESISILASGNATPLVASFQLGEGAIGFVSTRIKMGKTADVIAVVKTAEGVYSTSKNVKVTIGGCGG